MGGTGNHVKQRKSNSMRQMSHAFSHMQNLDFNSCIIYIGHESRKKSLPGEDRVKGGQDASSPPGSLIRVIQQMSLITSSTFPFTSVTWTVT